MPSTQWRTHVSCDELEDFYARLLYIRIECNAFSQKVKTKKETLEECTTALGYFDIQRVFLEITARQCIMVCQRTSDNGNPESDDETLFKLDHAAQHGQLHVLQ